MLFNLYRQANSPWKILMMRLIAYLSAVSKLIDNSDELGYARPPIGFGYTSNLHTSVITLAGCIVFSSRTIPSAIYIDSAAVEYQRRLESEF